MKKLIKTALLAIGSFVGMLLIVSALFLQMSPQFGAQSEGTFAAKIENSPNYRDERFQNIEETEVTKDFNLSSLTGFFTTGNKAPDWSIPVKRIDPNAFNDKQDSLAKITWFGHSTMLLELDGKNVFLDPMLSNVAAPHPWLGTPRFNDTLPLAIDVLPQLDAVLISHDHYDHLDYESIVRIKDKVNMFFTPLGVGAHLRFWGVAEEKITELDWWESADFEGLTFVSTPARHFSGRGVCDAYKTLWCSWVIRGKQTTLFFGGDSGYDQSFKKIGNVYGPFDVTMLECGQYDEQWPEIHMMPEEAVQAHIDLRGRLLMPIHWGAFKLALHRWNEPPARLVRKANEMNVQVTIPIIGDPIIVGKSEPLSYWWNRKNTADMQ